MLLVNPGAVCIPTSSKPPKFQAPVADFIPSSIPGLVMELYGSNLTGNDGDAITTWPDPFAGSNPTQAVAGAKPTKKTNILNGLAIARGDGGDTLGTAAPVTTALEFTMFAVVKQTTGGSTQVFLCNGESGGSGYCFYFSNTGGRFMLFGGIGNIADMGVTSGAWEIWGCRRSVANGVNMTISGSPPVSLPDSVPTAPANTTRVIGEAASNFLIGDQFASLIWDNDIGASNFARVFTYLSNLTGIAE